MVLYATGNRYFFSPCMFVWWAEQGISQTDWSQDYVSGDCNILKSLSLPNLKEKDNSVLLKVFFPVN